MNNEELETKALFIREKVFALLTELTTIEGINDLLILYAMFAACFELVRSKAQMNNLPPNILYADVENIFFNVAASAKMIEAKNAKTN